MDRAYIECVWPNTEWHRQHQQSHTLTHIYYYYYTYVAPNPTSILTFSKRRPPTGRNFRSQITTCLSKTFPQSPLNKLQSTISSLVFFFFFKSSLFPHRLVVAKIHFFSSAHKITFQILFYNSIPHHFPLFL